jgi:phosphorylase kinase alpha/beta subunit
MSHGTPIQARQPRFALADYTHRPRELREDLLRAGALTFTPYASGLFPASDLSEKLGEETGMTMAWLRDNAHVIAALYDTGQDRAGAIRAAEGILQVLRASEIVLDAAISDPHDTRKRLTVRIDGNTLTPDAEPRVQNDSTGYALWITSKLMLDGSLPVNQEDFAIIIKIAKYLEAIEYWHDPDDSAWEEDRRIHLSSIGVVVAGLTTADKLLRAHDINPGINISSLIEHGHAAMRDIWQRGYTDHPDHPRTEHDDISGDWPLELTVEESLRDALKDFRLRPRPHDAALLFLVEPLSAVDPEMARSIVEDIEQHLKRKRGIARYPGDTYWSPYFDELVEVEARTQAAEGRTEARNLKAAGIALTGSEAQWTLFDPLLSSYYGKQFQQTNAPEDREKQLHYLDRSLSQLTPTSEGPRLPEAYYLTHDKANGRNRWQPNPHTPLLWSQANLLRALKVFEDTTPTSPSS